MVIQINKTTLLLVAALLILGVVSGCGPGQSPPPEATPTSPSPATSPPSTPEPTLPASTSPAPEKPASPAVSPEGLLRVHFIDVGQGDAILIDLEDVEALIDGGDRSPGVVSYLEDHIDGALEVMVATHPHADHIGGLIDVLAAFEVQQIWHNGDTASSKTYADFMAAVNAENSRVVKAVRGNNIEAGGLRFHILHPENLQGTTNNNSVVLYLAFGEIDYLFTGDAEHEAEASMVSLGLVPDVEIMKVGHHGSRTASSGAFLAQSSPEFAIYMAGAENRYGHPHDEALAALTATEASILGTDTNGTIVVITDGKSITVETAKGEAASMPAPKPTPTPSPEATVAVIIQSIDLEAELVVIKNVGSEPVELTGWKLVSEVGQQEFTFPELTLQPGSSVQVSSGRRARDDPPNDLLWSKTYVWNNDGDPGKLLNEVGTVVSRYPD